MSLRLDDQICFPIHAAARRMTALYRPLLSPLGLTYPQYLVMLVLWEEEGLSVSAIGQRLALDSGTLTPLLKRLAGQGLVDRERDPADNRVVIVRLSEAGRSLEAEAEAIPAALAACVAPSGADPAAVEQLKQTLDALNLALAEALA